MDELRQLIEMVAGLPNVVLWVLIGYLVYKLVVVGSIYGVIRLAIMQFVSAYNANRNKTVTHIWQFGEYKILESAKPILETILQNSMRASGNYLHKSDVEQIKKAIEFYETNKDKKGL